MRDPLPLAITTGLPPTPPKARTGELTPPGKIPRLRSIKACERSLPAKAVRAGRRERQRPPGDLPWRRRIGNVPDRGSREIVIVTHFGNGDLDERAGAASGIDPGLAVHVVGLPLQS